MDAAKAVERLTSKNVDLWRKLDEIVTAESYFDLFKQLSDNYSPTLTVSRVQGPLVAELLAHSGGNVSPISVTPNLRGSGSIGIRLGRRAAAPVWLSGHADICSYLTGVRQGSRYALTPFCMHRAGAGRRAAAALGAPDGQGPLAHLAYGDMVTAEDGTVTFETDRADLAQWTRVVHHLPATWDAASDEFHGFIDNQGTCAALLLAARVLSHFQVDALLVLNDEEEGPVDKGNQGFSRAMTRLLHRTPFQELPEVVFVSDVQQQESRIDMGEQPYFGQGALFSGSSSGARGAVTPPQQVAFTRDLARVLAEYGIQLEENESYVSRSDDISAMLYTQNVHLVGFPGTSAHFDHTPTARCSDLVHLTKTLVVYALIAQDEEWRRAYL